ncbi:hypothetical protein [Ruminococcus sp.]|uniref:hypothetical protein n=1 Tax=Ruminococcus sp. TaxID=41978 RepID=UPI001B70C33C|nr:hypothetical protein [Ruminococcus sp.]MBP5432180.1 hypothetical protein [Ruminococcus sp.]
MADEFIRLDTTIMGIDGLINEAPTGSQARALFCAKDMIYDQQRYVSEMKPVKRGTWRKDEQGYDVYVECSECGLNLSTSNYIENEWRDILKYCPCCGADMRDVPDTDVGEIANVVEFKKRLTDRKTAEALRSNAEGLLSKGMQVDIADLRYIKLAEYENKEENNVETTGS